MQQSIAARNVARTAGRYVRSTSTSRGRRLGLGPTTPVQADSAYPTAIDRDGLGPFVLLRARWRSFAPASVSPRPLGTVRHLGRMAWSGAGHTSGRHAGVPATWPD